MTLDQLPQLRIALDLLREIRLADVVDIALVTTLLYTVVVLIRRTQAGFVAIGILILGGLYIAARVIDLRLTAWIFQGFFAVLLVILVVVFQEELRQLFERIALLGLRRGNHRASQLGSTDMLVKCLADAARDRIGALVVLPGLQPILRHVQGGVELNGRLSEPLLKSLLDPHSPGHDGAVIIEQDRITRFAAHLPLSTDFEQLASVGTRHGAALGLSELSDALCLVVSEERGQISVARGGRLERVANAQRLSEIVGDFLREMHPSAAQKPVWWQLIRENWVEKLVSLALVLSLWWLFVPGSRPASFRYAVPVQVAHLPPDLVLEGIDPPTVNVVFSGRRRAFYLFAPSQTDITIDASLAKLGRRTFTVSADELRYPKDLEIDEIDPPQVKISLRAAPEPTAQSTPPEPTAAPL